MPTVLDFRFTLGEMGDAIGYFERKEDELRSEMKRGKERDKRRGMTMTADLQGKSAPRTSAKAVRTG